MAHQPSRSPVRLLAPVALVLTFLAFAFVVLSSREDNDAAPASDTSTAPKSDTQASTAPKPKPKPATYTVKAGDNLGSISEKTQVPIETLQELNPELVPQALVSGQKIKLKE
ncbi:MAG TPA: LysM domain-containing protein [Thermoleophilaceae bacterium]|nr:LysM domain-containing protein [Thermoleophilaceae bacterium]